MRIRLYLLWGACLALAFSCKEKPLDPEEQPPVVKPVRVEKVTLTPENLSLQVGEAAQLRYVVEPEGAEIESVTWSSSRTAVATVAEGKVTAVGAGTSVITLKVNDLDAHCTVAVETPFVAVESITLDKTELSMWKDETATLTATVLPDNATEPAVTWTSSANRFVTVDSEGNLTAKRTGTAVITAQAGSCSATCTVTVFTHATSIGLNLSSATLRPLQTLQLEVSAAPTGAFVDDIRWTSSHPGLAVVDENGLVTALADGSVTITATMGELTATCDILVSSVASGDNESTGREEWE